MLGAAGANERGVVWAMAASNEMARVKREVEALVTAVDMALGPRSKAPMTPAERRLLRSEIEHCAQRLDELRNRLSS